MRVAQIIVDVKAMQTDQPYTYLIPVKYQDFIVEGMQVTVPFGKSNRHVQGFVVGFSESKEVAELKEIASIDDVKPVLNTELLALADYMKDTTYAFKISCLQTMLPNALKNKYKKQIVVTGDTPEELQEFFVTGSLAYEEALQHPAWPKIAQGLKDNKLSYQYEKIPVARIKTVTHIKRLKTTEELTKIASNLKNAPKKQAIIAKLLTMEQAELINMNLFKEATGATRTQLNQARESGWLDYEEVEVYRDAINHQYQEQTQWKLNQEQADAYEQVKQAMNEQESKVFLLEGITGSGKTAVYIELIKSALAEGKTALMLVPEITLTPQMIAKLSSVFKDQVAVLHSALSTGERYDEWRKIESGQANVVIGARSAIFAPLRNLGVIIIDEEHESTYKQEETPRYHARDIAIWRGNYNHCPVVLGSATPSLESRARALKGNYQLLRLTKRAVATASLPVVNIIDMKLANVTENLFSQELLTALDNNVASGNQSVLLLNKRGFASFMLCNDCGYVMQCPHCDVSLTLHKEHYAEIMRCHYCGYEEQAPHRCPICQSTKIDFFGAGTQQVEEKLQNLLPKARILRMDVDTTRKKGQHEKILTAFKEHRADILLGTQMIAKGLDFPDVTLVGVLNADTALNLPDFRASERTFQLLTQVSGRAGRADKPGQVLIQTYNPSHYALQYAAKQDYEGFFKYEMQVRHLGNYPPYYYTLQITISHANDLLAAQKSQEILAELQPYFSRKMYVLGPTKSAIAKIKNKYYYQIVIKYKNDEKLVHVLKDLLSKWQRLSLEGYQIKIDKEPNKFV